jgi:hypothetical protein
MRTDLTPLKVIRTETVLSRLPIHNLAKKGKLDIRITRKHAGGDVDLKWEVSYSERYGQPRQLAYKLDTLVVNRRIDEQGRPLPKLIRIGSLKQICKDLGMTESGKNARGIKTAFLQNATAFISANLHYRGTNGVERRLDAGFTRYGVVFTGETLPDGASADAVYIVLNDPYRDVVDHAPQRPLNYDYLRELRPAAQRFYEILSYRIFAALKNNRPFARMLYSEYCLFSAQQRYFHYDRFRVQMYKVQRPHLESGYLAGFRYQAVTDGERKADWLMTFTPGPKARAEFEVFTNKRYLEAAPETVEEDSAGTPAPELPDLAGELVRRGVTAPQARKLAARIPAGQPARQQLEWGDFLIAQSGGRGFRNPAGFYVSLLRDNVAMPEGFGTAHSGAEETHSSSPAADAEQRLAYEEYRTTELARYVASSVPREQFAAAFEQKRREYAQRYRGLTAATLDEISERAARADFEQEARLASFEDFCRESSGQPRSSD